MSITPNSIFTERVDMSRVGLGGRRTRSVRQNPRTVRAGMPWSAVYGRVPRFVNFGLGGEDPGMILGKNRSEDSGQA